MVRALGLPWISLGCLMFVACGDKPAATTGPNTSSPDTTSEGEQTTADNPTTKGPTGATEGATESAEATSIGPTSMSDPASTSTTAPDPGGSSSSGDGFIVPPDGGVSGECDPKLQDCPRGEKCTAVSSGPGEPWGVNQCVPVMGDSTVGDPCDIMDGKYTGLDNCDVGFICLLTDDDGKGGACVEFCDENSLCPLTDANCVVYNDGSLPICLASCDPLVQDCPEGQACYSSAGDLFVCFKESAMPGEGMPGQECQYVNQCQEGSFCAATAAVANCPPESTGCCTPYCPVDEGPGPCQPTEECVEFFDAGTAPPGYENVGVCAVPG